MLSMLIAYDVDNNIIATLNYLVAMDESGNAVGLIDFEQQEESGESLKDVWQVENAIGSGTWPEWIGSSIYDFKVETLGEGRQKRIQALTHKHSGVRRERAVVKAAIENRIKEANGAPADISDLVGGPDRPLRLDAEGRTTPKFVPERPSLPTIKRVTNPIGE